MISSASDTGLAASVGATCLAPVVKESEYISQESNSFLNRYYDGDITAMLSAYIENDKLSETEIDTLRSLLSNRSKKGGN